MYILPTRVHGVLVYLVSALLIISPWLLGFAEGGPETWVPVALGTGGILYSLLTDYELGAIRLIPMPVHLVADLASGALLAMSPWLFGFADDAWTPHVIFGFTEVLIALLTNTRATPDARGRIRRHRGGDHRLGEPAPARPPVRPAEPRGRATS